MRTLVVIFQDRLFTLTNEDLKGILTLYVLTVLLSGCDKTNRNSNLIQGNWMVSELSSYPLTITNYNDAKLDKNSRVTFDDKNQMKIFLTNATESPEVFDYRIQDNKLILLYSDYGIPLTIKKLSDFELEMETGGFGNTDSERKLIKISNLTEFVNEKLPPTKAIKHMLYCRFLKCVLLNFVQNMGQGRAYLNAYVL